MAMNRVEVERRGRGSWRVVISVRKNEHGQFAAGRTDPPDSDSSSIDRFLQLLVKTAFFVRTYRKDSER